MVDRLRFEYYGNVGEEARNLAVNSVTQGLDGEKPWITVVGGPHPGSFIERVSRVPVAGDNRFLLRVRTSQKEPLKPEDVNTGLKSEEPKIYLEGFGRFSGSLVWRLNEAFWNSFPVWEEALDKRFTEGLPTDGSDVGSKVFWEKKGGTFVNRIDGEGDIRIAEVGASAGRESRNILEVLQKELKPEVFQRIRWGIIDRSPVAIAKSRKELQAFERQTVLIESGADALSLHRNPYLREGVKGILVGNMFDNFAANQHVFADGSFYSAESRMFIREGEWKRISEEYEREGTPQHLIDSIAGINEGKGFDGRNLTTSDVKLWKSFFDSMKAEQRLIPVAARTAVDWYGTRLSDFKTPEKGFSLFNTSEIGPDVLKEFTAILSRGGIIALFDIFRKNLGDFMSGPSDPRRFDGSVFSWVNKEQLELVAATDGLGVREKKFAEFNTRSRSSVVLIGSEQTISGLI